MARITKKQENLYLHLVKLHHELIRARHLNNKEQFDEAIANIREAVAEPKEKKEES